MSVFTVHLETEHDAMRTVHDIAGAPRSIADQIEVEGLCPNSAQWVRDINGNRVGTFGSIGCVMQTCMR